ncbi:ASCH domain-containing protein [Paeniglutamicibacter antarcticus]|uniref:ASCH domain-containing protein n=1 Tax=Arthrobacter terrae TaxID=2935737 RepID=A0A931CM98_9MICC|nr:ASCH domain-containing protein [Arthrobacter terrae]MBG0740868.1 ASCH domain-containing protein [Arthrobacter terrae]
MTLPIFEFSLPGPLRDQLVAAVLDGSKTSTTGLLRGYEVQNLPLNEIGSQSAVIDSEGRRVAVIEITSVRVVQLGDVDLAHVLDEGEGLTTVAQWRAVHEQGWHSPAERAELGDPTFTANDATPLVLQRFRLVTNMS